VGGLQVCHFETGDEDSGTATWEGSWGREETDQAYGSIRLSFSLTVKRRNGKPLPDFFPTTQSTKGLPWQVSSQAGYARRIL